MPNTNTYTITAGQTLSAVIATMRLPFLLLTPACLFLAFSLAYKNNLAIAWPLIILITAGAISAHLAVNMLNEYVDFRSGLDFQTKRTPLSGGSGGLLQQPNAQRVVLLVACLNLLVCCCIGAYLAFTAGLELLSIGLLGVIIIVTYTRWLNRLPFLCLIAPGFAFGILLVNGSYFVLTQTFNIQVLLISLLPFFLVNNLLLLNQFPDIEADKAHGRQHLLIKYGVNQGVSAYIVLAVLSVVTLISLIVIDYLPSLSAAGLLPLLLALIIGMQLKNLVMTSTGELNNNELMPLMAKNVAVTILTPVLVALGVIGF